MFTWNLRNKKSTEQISPADSAFMNDVQESLLAQRTPGSLIVLYMVLFVLIAGLAWAHFSRVEEITHGEAKIIPISHEQVIQSLEGGILEKIEVREGDIVEKGQTLVKLDPTRAEVSYHEALRKAVALKATITRLRAEAYEIPLKFDDDVLAYKEEVDQETKAYNARKNALNDSVASLETSYALSAKEIAMAEPLAAKGLLSEVEILRMRRQANEIRFQIAERKSRYKVDANNEAIKLDLELTSLQENLIGRADVVARTTITAPVKGTVKNVRYTTIGAVIEPGKPILEIIPLEEKLLVEAKIRPSDVAFLRPGLSAMVKITAYDFAIYGGLKGTVQYVSPDTLKDDQKAPNGRDDTFYRVLVITDKSSLSSGGKELPIIPGMVASVDIRTGEKTILEYLLKPALKAREAFRER